MIDNSHEKKHQVLPKALPLVLAITSIVSSGLSSAEDAAGSSDYALEEVVVTAQKRAQSMQDVSVAVTAFNAQMLEELGVDEPLDLAQQTPNLNIKNVVNKSAPIFTIRGIGNAAFTSNVVSPVGVYVDELFLPTNTMMSFSVFDLEGVEVLKGPQGTLFGRNTTAGAVSFRTKRPSQDTDDGYAKFSVGNYQTFDSEMAKNFSLSERVSTRLSGKWSSQGEGTFTNMNNGEHDVGTAQSYALRAGLLAELDKGDIYINVHGGSERSENEPWVGIGRGALDNPSGEAPELPGVNGLQYRNDCLSRSSNSIDTFINDTNCVSRVGYYDPYTDPRVGEFSNDPKIESDSLGALVNLDLDLGYVQFVSVTAYETLDKLTGEDFDGSPFRIGDTSYQNDVEVFSQEFRFVSAQPIANRIDWVAGVVYYQDQQNVEDLYGYTDRVNHDVLVKFVQDTTSLAAYFHTETQLTERLRLIAGIRLSDDTIGFDGGTSVVNLDDDFTGDVTFFSVDTPILVEDEDITSTEVTGKLGLDYDVGDNTLLYANYSRGYKAGVWNGFWAATEGDHSSTEPEFINAYEVGVKTTLLEGRMRLNSAVYSYDYTDMQLFADQPDGRYTIFNAGSAEVSGAEIELNWMVTPSFELRAGLGYTDAKVSASVGLLEFNNARPANTPEMTFNIFGRYEKAVGSANWYLQGDYAYQDDVYFSLDNLQAISQESYGLFGAKTGIVFSNGWDLSLWGKNITDELYYTEILTSGSAGVVSGQVSSPRTFGVSLKVNI